MMLNIFFLKIMREMKSTILNKLLSHNYSKLGLERRARNTLSSQWMQMTVQITINVIFLQNSKKLLDLHQMKNINYMKNQRSNAKESNSILTTLLNSPTSSYKMILIINIAAQKITTATMLVTSSESQSLDPFEFLYSIPFSPIQATLFQNKIEKDY